MPNQKNKLTIFKTSNFPLAIYLRAKACKLLRITKIDSKRALFCFENSPLTQRLAVNFWEAKALIEPHLFYDAQRQLKSLLYDESYTNQNSVVQGSTVTSVQATLNKTDKVNGDRPKRPIY